MPAPLDTAQAVTVWQAPHSCGATSVLVCDLDTVHTVADATLHPRSNAHNIAATPHLIDECDVLGSIQLQHNVRSVWVCASWPSSIAPSERTCREAHGLEPDLKGGDVSVDDSSEGWVLCICR